MSKFAIIDVETTGGVARYERITEIAVVVHDGEKVIDSYSTLLNPERSIPWSITQLTGITDEMVAHAPKFYEVARKIVEMTEDAVFVAHNVNFDYSFVREEFARLGYTFSRRQLCTVRLSRKVFPGLPSYSLSNLKKHFGIYAERSHRALDDTLATVHIFERILEAQAGNGSVKKMLQQGMRETKLPQNVSLQRLQELPEACGVYYLHDDKGEVIYVGKSLNIQKRLFEHFADMTPKGEKLRTGVADMSYEVTGSELVALLLESAEIKRLQPRVNRAQRISHFSGCIYTYTDQSGYICLAAGKRTLKNAAQLQLVADYPKVDSARAHLQSLVRQFELCEKLCNLDFHEKACFHYAIKKCRGACIGAESVEDYNERVEQALTLINKRLQGNYFILDDGRTHHETAIVCVENGTYKGFGYIDADFGAFGAEELMHSIKPVSMNDPDAGRIIRSFIEGKKRLKVIPF